MGDVDSKKILLVGHCGPDSSFLRMVVKRAEPTAQILAADDDRELAKALEGGVDVILFNRELGYGFDQPEGVEQIRRLRSLYPDTRMMLVSNYSDAQTRAEQAGAMPGFGKREIGQPHVTERLRAAIGSLRSDVKRET